MCLLKKLWEVNVKSIETELEMVDPTNLGTLCGSHATPKISYTSKMKSNFS